jgi:hypothetical protein
VGPRAQGGGEEERGGVANSALHIPEFTPRDEETRRAYSAIIGALFEIVNAASQCDRSNHGAKLLPGFYETRNRLPPLECEEGVDHQELDVPLRRPKGGSP